jgi:cyclopropane fatty-acyl-phospholipid synthase-like methyltransferase
MRYHGFATRDYLILDHIQLKKDSSVLEIGVGTGSTADLIAGKIKEYCGVDISVKVINWLNSLYENVDSVSWYCLDACKDSSNLDKKFDVVFSADTLEHVESPLGHFNFIKRHLSFNGVALVTYPNESEEKRHGITHMNSKTELLETINKTGLKVIKLCEVKQSAWHLFIKNTLWEFPKSIISRNNKSPQTFDQTEGFQIANSDSLKSKIFAFYAKTLTKLAAVVPLYNYFDIGEKINNKILLITLKHK